MKARTKITPSLSRGARGERIIPKTAPRQRSQRCLVLTRANPEIAILALVAKLTKSTPWLNLASGLLFLFAAARDKWMPGFLSMAGGHHHGDPWLQLTTAALFLFAACREFMRMRTRSAQ